MYILQLIATASLVNITIFFLVMRTFKIYSLSNFQINNMVLLTLVAVLYITSLGLISYLKVCILQPPSLLSFTSQLPPLATTKLFSVSMSSVFFDSTYK